MLGTNYTAYSSCLLTCLRRYEVLSRAYSSYAQVCVRPLKPHDSCILVSKVIFKE
jgi:hypothetical protein